MQARRLMMMVLPLAFARVLPAQQQSSQTLVFAVYEGQATAGEVLTSMRKSQHAAGERLESYAVVAKSQSGKIAVNQRPSEPSPAIDDLLGTLGEPARNATAIGRDVVDSLRASLAPGSSAVIAVMNDRWARDVERDLRSARARTMLLRRITEGESNGSR